MAKKKHKARKVPKITPQQVRSELTGKGTQVLAQTLGPDCIAYNVKPEDAHFVAKALSEIVHRHFQLSLLRLEQHNE
jgi:hypothetical protein